MASSSWLPWAVLVFGAMLVWAAIYLKSGSFRKSMIGALLVAKTFVVVYKLAGLDRPVLVFYLLHRSTGAVRVVAVTACELLFLAFLASLLLVLAWPALVERLPREVREEIEKLVSS